MKVVDFMVKNFYWMDMKFVLFEVVEWKKDWVIFVDEEDNFIEVVGVNVFFIKNGEFYMFVEGCLLGIMC